ncbi:MAG: hypothetical protein ACLSH6_04675 [Limosilactobacillus pontis]
MRHHWNSRGEFWGYLATFLHTTLHAPVREPYKDLQAILQGKDYFILTTNQDTQAIKAFPEEKVAQIQGIIVSFNAASSVWMTYGTLRES